MQEPVQAGVEQTQKEKAPLIDTEQFAQVFRTHLRSAIDNKRDGHFAVRRRDEPMFTINFARVGEDEVATQRFRDELLKETTDTLDLGKLIVLMGTAYRQGIEHVITGVLESELGPGGKWSNTWPMESTTLVYVTQTYVILFMAEKPEIQ